MTPTEQATRDAALEEAARERDAIAKEIESMHWLFPRGDNRKDDVRALARRIRSLRSTAGEPAPDVLAETVSNVAAVAEEIHRGTWQAVSRASLESVARAVLAALRERRDGGGR